MGARPKRILVAPLNWGLGHATRCIPLIKSLQQNQCEVIIAANGAAATVLRNEFPDLLFITTPGIEIKYSSSGLFFVWRLLLQIPALLKQLRDENKWLKQQIPLLNIDGVISDNRYGLHNPAILSILITHQLGILSGFGQWLDSMINSFVFSYLNQFDEIWVPDYEKPYALAGALSHPKKLPKTPIKYIGILNRFSSLPIPPPLPSSHLLLLVSGPEPQRSLLEEKFRNEVVAYTGTFTLVCGKPGLTHHNKSLVTDKLTLFYGSSTNAIHEHLDAHQLQEEINKAEFIICRSGYTSLMELIPTGKKLLLIPTPGQAEQTYLAKYCQEQGYAPYLTQKEFTLEKALQVIQQFSYTPYRPPAMELIQWIKNWLNHTR